MNQRPIDYMPPRIPTEVWVDNILPRAAESGFLPGMLGASRQTRALALQAHVNVMNEEQNASPLPRAPHLPQPSGPRRSLPQPAILAHARRYEQKMRTRGGDTELDMIEKAMDRFVEMSGAGEIDNFVMRIQSIRDLFHARVPSLYLGNLELHTIPANLFDHDQLQGLSFVGNNFHAISLERPLPNLEVLLMHCSRHDLPGPLAHTSTEEMALKLPNLRFFSFDASEEDLTTNRAHLWIPLTCVHLQFVCIEVDEVAQASPVLDEIKLRPLILGGLERTLALIQVENHFDTQRLTFSMVRDVEADTTDPAWRAQQLIEKAALLKKNGVLIDWCFDR